MPDFDFDGLRAGLRESVRQPPVDDVIARARRRTTRRRKQIVSAAAVVLAMAVVPLTRLGVQRDTAPPLSPADQNFVVSLDFYDNGHGFVLGGSCEHRPICRPWLMATTDGQVWEERGTPPLETGYSGRPDRLVALGVSAVLIEDHRSGGAVKRFYSADGARNWQEVPVTPDPEPVTAIAPSAVLDCRDGKVNVLMPRTGRTARLASQPPLAVSSCETYPDGQWRWWVAGLDSATGRPMVASSKDGTKWTTGALPPFTPPAAEQIISPGYPAISIAVTPAAVYATLANPGDTPADLVAIFRSVDNGVTWELVWQAGKGRQPASIAGEPVAGTDGTLRISQYPRVRNEVWTSTDSGRSFTAEPSRAASDVRRIRTGYVATGGAPATRFLTSMDGIRWQEHDPRAP